MKAEVDSIDDVFFSLNFNDKSEWIYRGRFEVIVFCVITSIHKLSTNQ